jgi:hypothetical protein
MQFRVEHEIKSLDTYYVEANTSDEVLPMWKNRLVPDKKVGWAEKAVSKNVIRLKSENWLLFYWRLWKNRRNTAPASRLSVR